MGQVRWNRHIFRILQLSAREALTGNFLYGVSGNNSKPDVFRGDEARTRPHLIYNVPCYTPTLSWLLLSDLLLRKNQTILQILVGERSNVVRKVCSVNDALKCQVAGIIKVLFFENIMAYFVFVV